jgi:hypothetical protein
MKNLFASKTIRILLSLLVVAVAFQALVEPPIQDRDFQDIKVTYASKMIYMDIYFKRPISCKKLMSQMDIQPFDVRSITYFPTCTTFDNGIRITYTENVRA